MLKLNLSGKSQLSTMLRIVLDAVLSRVNEAQEKFKRCCIAFADMCCATSKTETGCCEIACKDEDGCIIPILDCSGGSYHPEKNMSGLVGEQVDSLADKEEDDVKEKIVLEVIGMDCPDCLSKVTQAVRILSGAEVTNADGVRGLVSVKYDPRESSHARHVPIAEQAGLIDLKAIETFTARASGFRINVLGGGVLDKSKTLVLPLSFERMPHQTVLAKYESNNLRTNASRKNWWNLAFQNTSDQGGQVDIILRLDPSKQITPRSILGDLAEYGVTIQPPLVDQNQARIYRDLRNIAFRALASLIFTIPILVLVWSPRPLAASDASHAVQLALATLVIIVAWPVYSGSFRSAYYLRRADLGVLTSFSTLTSYIFSVIAFGFQVGGRDIGEPFFETVGLLITLIFAGRTLQAGTRKFGLKAVDNLGKLQPQTARLLVNREETDLDVRYVL